MTTEDGKLISFRRLENNELGTLVDLIKLYESVFDMKNLILPSEEYLKGLLNNNNIIFYVGLLDNSVIGGLTAHALPSVYFLSSEIYIYDLAVKPDLQRKGIGRQLISSLKKYCLAIGHKEIFVQATFEDQHAIDFYKSTGGHSECVFHFSYSLSDTF